MWGGRVWGKLGVSGTEGYKSENGKLGDSSRGAALIGDGPGVLTKVTGIGNDMAIDEGIGITGKGGQSDPAGVGQPTLRVNGLTVRGTAEPQRSSLRAKGSNDDGQIGRAGAWTGVTTARGVCRRLHEHTKITPTREREKPTI